MRERERLTCVNDIALFGFIKDWSLGCPDALIVENDGNERQGNVICFGEDKEEEEKKQTPFSLVP